MEERVLFKLFLFFCYSVKNNCMDLKFSKYLDLNVGQSLFGLCKCPII